MRALPSILILATLVTSIDLHAQANFHAKNNQAMFCANERIAAALANVDSRKRNQDYYALAEDGLCHHLAIDQSFSVLKTEPVFINGRRRNVALIQLIGVFDQRRPDQAGGYLDASYLNVTPTNSDTQQGMSGYLPSQPTYSITPIKPGEADMKQAPDTPHTNPTLDGPANL